MAIRIRDFGIIKFCFESVSESKISISKAPRTQSRMYDPADGANFAVLDNLEVSRISEIDAG